MKKAIIVVAFLLVGQVCRADLIVAHDEALNHIGAPYWQNWQNNHNGGFGFQPWQLWNVGSGGTFIYSSTQFGAGNVNSEGNWAFSMWANPVGNNHSYARRFFEDPLTTGLEFRMDIAPSSQAGTRGVSLLDAQTNVLLTISFGNDDYQVGGVSLGWTYSQSSVFNLSARASGPDQTTVTLMRGEESYSTVVDGTTAGFLAFTGNSPSGGANNF